MEVVFGWYNYGREGDVALPIKGNKTPGYLRPNWKGDNATPDAARQRSYALIKKPSKGYEIHHIDGNPYNNVASNLEIVTKSKHMHIDGRINRLVSLNNPWSNEEIKILTEHYPSLGGKIKQYLPKRTIDAIELKARKLGLRVNRSVPNVFRRGPC